MQRYGDRPKSGIEYFENRVDLLKVRDAQRIKRSAEVYAVRHGNFDQVAPNLFSPEWPRPIVANMIDVYAKHASAALSPLPIFSCQSGTGGTQLARDFGDKRTKIVNGYAKRSKLAAQMQQGADQFYTYGLLVTSVEPDADGKPFPTAIIEDSVGFYPVWDRLGRTVEVASSKRVSLIELQAAYPDRSTEIMAAHGERNGSKTIEVIKYIGPKNIIVWLKGERATCVLVNRVNPLGRCSVIATRKPGLDDEIRGTFDDLIWVQLARHAMQMYVLEATAQAVEAPLVVPTDVIDVPSGPGAIIRSSNPTGVGRVDLKVPREAFMAGDMLKAELQYGAISPEALGGSIDASVVTGKGVQQLMAGYSQQIAMGQQTLVGHFEQVLEVSLEMDELLWPEEQKSIRGKVANAPFDVEYTPSKDIKGDYSVDVEYGGIAGLDPNRALIYLLQGRGDGLFSKDYVRRRLPSDINPHEEETKILAEQTRESLMQGFSAFQQQAQVTAAASGDTQAIATAIQSAAAVIRAIEKGKTIEEALAAAYPIEPPTPPSQVPTPPGMEGMTAPGGAAQDPNGMAALASGGVPTRGAEARPDLQTMFAGMNGNSPNISAGVSRYIPAS